MFESIVQHQGNKFYQIKEDVIADVQEELGIILPNGLKEFYKEVGYGFLSSKRYNFNRIMSPKSLCDFRFRKDQFCDDSELEMYEEYERDQIVFFEISEGSFLSMGFSKENCGEVFCGKVKIANSLLEFLEKYQEDENYFEM